MGRYVGAIDQGTTSSRFMVFDRAGAVIAQAQEEHAQIYPAPGHVEHDAAEIWAKSGDCAAASERLSAPDHDRKSPN